METLSAATREALIDLADRMIPAEGEMPAAGSVIAGADLGPVVEELPDLVPAVEKALASVAEVPERERFKALAENDADGLAAVGELVAAAYFLDPEISRLVGYRRREAVPIAVDPDLVELTRPVVALGFSSPVPGTG